MVIKIDIDNRNLEVIEDELTMLLEELEFNESCYKDLRRCGVKEKVIAERLNMSILEYRKTRSRNHAMKKLFKSILNGMNK